MALSSVLHAQCLGDTLQSHYFPPPQALVWVPGVPSETQRNECIHQGSKLGETVDLRLNMVSSSFEDWLFGDAFSCKQETPFHARLMRCVYRYI